MAELFFKDLIAVCGVSDRFCVDSCATSGYEVGNPVYPPALKTLRAHGVSGNHTARIITPDDLAKSDYILVMDEENLRAVTRLAKDGERGKIRKLCSFTARRATLPIRGTRVTSKRRLPILRTGAPPFSTIS